MPAGLGASALLGARPAHSQQWVLLIPDYLVAQQMLAECWDLMTKRTRVKGAVMCLFIPRGQRQMAPHDVPGSQAVCLAAAPVCDELQGPV